jgi:maltodextrin utilization protein YvdJ
MITVRKFWTIVFITIALSFSLLAYADTYWFKGNKVKDKDGTEYLIFNDEHKVQLGFKVDGLNLVPIKDSKTDSIRKEIKKKEEAAEKAKKEAEQKEFEKDYNSFISNLLKLSMTLLGILATMIVVSILSIILWLGFCLYLKIKKS